MWLEWKKHLVKWSNVQLLFNANNVDCLKTVLGHILEVLRLSTVTDNNMLLLIRFCLQFYVMV